MVHVTKNEFPFLYVITQYRLVACYGQVDSHYCSIAVHTYSSTLVVPVPVLVVVQPSRLAGGRTGTVALMLGCTALRSLAANQPCSLLSQTLF